MAAPPPIRPQTDTTTETIGEIFGSPLGVEKSAGDLIGLLIGIATVIATLVGIFMIIMGGYHIIEGSGVSNPEHVKKGQNMLTYGLIGFVIIAAAFVIIRVVEKIVGIDFITSPVIEGLID